MKKNLQIFFIAALLIAGLPQLLCATVRISAQSGLFSDGSTWVGGIAPAIYDDIVISTGHNVTLDANAVVFNITIQNSATLDNDGYSITIDRSTIGNPVYTNNGFHQGAGKVICYDGYRTELVGNGVSNCDFEITSYGLSLVSGCALTINGNIQHASPGNNGMNGKSLIEAFTMGVSLTVNGNVIANENYNVSITMVESSSLSISGDLQLPGSIGNGSGSVIENHGSILIGGQLKLGPYASYVDNFGTIEIGGTLSGDYDTYFIQESGAVAKFGGAVFPLDEGYLFANDSPIYGSSHPNIIEFNGIADQVVAFPADAAYSNLVINNNGAVASIVSGINILGSLTLKPGSALTVDPSGNLSVSENIMLESDAQATASLINTTSNNASIERYIAGHNNAGIAWGWHLLSSPIANQPISDFHTAGSGDDFYKWSESEALWINRTNASNGLNLDFETNFIGGRGYLIANVNADTKSFDGMINVANISVSDMSYTGNTGLTGWHLLGNPFSSALMWNNGNWLLNQVDAVAQIWNESTASYNVLLPNSVVPSMNGFFVHVSQNNASLTIPASARTHTAQNWFKQNAASQSIVITAKDIDGGTAQPTIIRADFAATEAYDPDFDSYFMAGFAPEFYSISQQKEFSLNTLKELSNGTAIELGFVKNGSQNFVFELTENTVNLPILLRDSKTGIVHELGSSGYSFVSEASDDPKRFTLHVGAVGIGESIIDQSFRVWGAGGKIHVQSPNCGMIQIFDAVGKLCFQGNCDQSDNFIVTKSLKPGVYVARLSGDDKQFQTKFIVQF